MAGRASAGLAGAVRGLGQRGRLVLVARGADPCRHADPVRCRSAVSDPVFGHRITADGVRLALPVRRRCPVGGDVGAISGRGEGALIDVCFTLAGTRRGDLGLCVFGGRVAGPLEVTDAVGGAGRRQELEAVVGHPAQDRGVTLGHGSADGVIQAGAATVGKLVLGAGIGARAGRAGVGERP